MAMQQPKNRFPYRLCLITDPVYLPEDRFEEKIEEALLGGVDMVQYRNSQEGKKERWRQARILRRLTLAHGAGLIINGDLELAVEVQADGIQLGKSSMPVLEARRSLGKDRWIGASVHSVREIQEAESSGADFLLLSPLFQPGSKKGVDGMGPQKFAKLCQNTSLPVLALGGITPENGQIAMGCGAYGLATISGILAAPFIQKAAEGMVFNIKA